MHTDQYIPTWRYAIYTRLNNFFFFAGRYDSTQLMLEWEVESPVTAALSDNSWVPYLTEYKLLRIIPNSSEHCIEPISLDPSSSQYPFNIFFHFLI